MNAEEIIALVHEIDAVEKQRADAEARISSLKEQLNQAVSKGPQPNGIGLVGPKRGFGFLGTKKTRESPRQDAIIRHIQENPRADYASLTQALYGSVTDEKTKNARTVIFHMKQGGRISGEPGNWKVRSTTPAEDEASDS